MLHRVHFRKTPQTMLGNRPNLASVGVALDCDAYHTIHPLPILLPLQHLTMVPTLITICYKPYNTTTLLFHLLRLFQWKQVWSYQSQKNLSSKLEDHQFKLLFQSLSLPFYSDVPKHPFRIVNLNCVMHVYVCLLVFC